MFTQSLNILFKILLPSKVYLEKSQVLLMSLPLYVISLFFSEKFKLSLFILEIWQLLNCQGYTLLNFFLYHCCLAFKKSPYF